MAGDVHAVGAALERLTALLPDAAPDIVETLRPPATETALDALRRAIEPYELPDELELLLRWADGQSWEVWWPYLPGYLMTAEGAAEHYRFLCTENPNAWCPLWIPFARAGWGQAALEAGVEQPGVVLDASFPNAFVTVIAPALATLLWAGIDLLEAGIPRRPADWADRAGVAAWKLDTDAVLQGRIQREGWKAWSAQRVISLDPAAWPAHWRRAHSARP